MTTDERLATMESHLTTYGPYGDWTEELLWLFALCRKQRAALRAVQAWVDSPGMRRMAVLAYVHGDRPAAEDVYPEDKVRAALEDDDAAG